jgi:WD40-like Beta Propeller Repeat
LKGRRRKTENPGVVHLRPARRSLAGAAALVALLGAASSAPDVEPWKPAGISSPMFESHAAFDPKTGDFYFVRSSPAFEGWRILVTRCGETGWSKPRDADFAGDGVEADPFFTPDGRTLYFISSRSTDGVRRKDLDLWRFDRDGKGAWGVPMRLPEPVNSEHTEWFPRPSPDGWLYFGSSRPGGLGGNDIWRARPAKDGRWTVENLGPSVNTSGDEYEALPSPDGSRMILMADGDLFESKREGGGWSRRVRLPPEINSEAMEVGAVFSPTGRSLLFARDTKGPGSGEFFVWRLGAPENWPPDCPGPAR